MKKNFQYTRRSSQRRLFAFEISQQAAAAHREALGEITPAPELNLEPSPTLVEGPVLRRKVVETEYQSN